MRKINFKEAMKEGEIINKDGYHQPDNTPYHMQGCGCKKTTKKGAYRDVSIEMKDGTIIHFYHQSPVIIEKDGKIRVDNCGYQTKSTKERINAHIPSGFKVIQRDFDWYINSWDPQTDYENREYKEIGFENGMILGD